MTQHLLHPLLFPLKIVRLADHISQKYELFFLTISRPQSEVTGQTEGAWQCIWNLRRNLFEFLPALLGCHTLLSVLYSRKHYNSLESLIYYLKYCTGIEAGNERYYATVCALHGLFYLLARANNAMVEMCFLFHIFILTWQRHQFQVDGQRCFFLCKLYSFLRDISVFETFLHPQNGKT